jgi:hypothetical protein
MAAQVKLDIRPTAAEAHSLFEETSAASPKPTLLPVCITVPADLLTPSAIYLKLSNGYDLCARPQLNLNLAHTARPAGQRDSRVLVLARERHGKH